MLTYGSEDRIETGQACNALNGYIEVEQVVSAQAHRPSLLYAYIMHTLALLVE